MQHHTYYFQHQSSTTPIIHYKSSQAPYHTDISMGRCITTILDALDHWSTYMYEYKETMTQVAIIPCVCTHVHALGLKVGHMNDTFYYCSSTVYTLLI